MIDSAHTQAAHLTERYAVFAANAHADFKRTCELDPRFVDTCLRALQAKRHRLGGPVVGELFPHIASENLQMDDLSRKTITSAWVALYGYATLVDFELDRSGKLTPPTAMCAAALLSWAIRTVTPLTSNTRFALQFGANIDAAFSAQYSDLTFRTDGEFDRSLIDIDKNRVFVAIISAYCAAANERDDRLIKITELLLEPFQLLDDLKDIYEDIREGNLTQFVRLLHCASTKTSELDLYRALIRRTETSVFLSKANDVVLKALVLVKSDREAALSWYLAELHKQLRNLIRDIALYQQDERSISEVRIYEQIRTLICGS